MKIIKNNKNEKNNYDRKIEENIKISFNYYLINEYNYYYDNNCPFEIKNNKSFFNKEEGYFSLNCIILYCEMRYFNDERIINNGLVELCNSLNELMENLEDMKGKINGIIHYCHYNKNGLMIDGIIFINSTNENMKKYKINFSIK